MSYKAGKTRLWKEVTEKHYDNPNDALLLAFEKGISSWKLNNVVPMYEEGTDEELWKVWHFLKKDVVPELVKESKEKDRTKLIGVDTVDRAIDAASAFVIKDCSQKFGKKFVSLQDISDNSGGKANGWVLLSEELKKPFDTLKNAGYGLMFLAWTKEKETTLQDGRKYNSLQLMMSNSGKKVFESQADLICCLHNEVTIFDKSGNELEDNLKDKKGKDKATNFHSTKTMMYFRPSDFVEIAGGRFTTLPEKVEYSSDEFLKVFKEAVEGQLNEEEKKNIDSIAEQQEEERQEKAEEAVEKLEEHQSSPEGILEEIESIVSSLDTPAKISLSNALKAEFKENDYRKFAKAEDVTKLQRTLKLAQEQVG